MILLLSLTMLKMLPQVCAETSIPKPAVPEFTIELIDSSYDVPASSSIDPYTGQTVTHPAAHIESRTIQVSIKNQPFTPYQIQDSNGNEWTINLYYNIRIKGHFSENWTELYRGSDGYPCQYSKDDVVLSYVLGEGDAYTDLGTISMKFPAGGQVDFQVEAMVGYVHREIIIPVSGWVFTGETSGWSNTQTITIGTSTPTPTPSPSPSSSPQETKPQPEVEPFPTTLVVASLVLVAVIGIGVLVYFKKRG